MIKLRAGLIGMGVMGRHHARVLSSLSGVDFVGVVEPMGTDVPVSVPVFRSLDDLLMHGIDYCVVAVPTAFHEAVGVRLASEGVHALVEKPLSHDTPSARRLTEAFDSAGLVGAVGHIERYNASLQQARARIAAGELGQVLQISTRRQGPYPPQTANAGVVKDLATHDIDLTAWISQQEYESVSAQIAHRSGREHEDLVAVVGRLTEGIVTNHLVNWLSPLKERTTVITGERGTLVADTLTADLTYYANGVISSEWDDMAMFRGVSEGDVIRYAFAKPEPLRTEHESFRNALLGLDSDVVTMTQGLRTVVIAEAILTSASECRTVTIPSLEPKQTGAFA